MISKNILTKMIEKGLTIAFAESMTGGKACYEMIQHPNASKAVMGGMIVYQNTLKTNWLDVSQEAINTYGVVSLEVAKQMAKSISIKANATIGVGITGNAGPSFQDESCGLVCYQSIIYKNEFYDMELVFKDLTREEAIDLTIEALYQKLDEILS